MSVSCFHCHLPITGTPRYFAVIEAVEQPMCCPGCKAVAEAIVAGGLDNYYRFRTEPAERAESANQVLQAELALYDRDDMQADFVRTTPEGSREARLLIEGITCSACVWLIEKHLSHLTGITGVTVNLSQHSATVSWDPDSIKLSDILLELHHIGYKGHPWRAERQEALMQQEHRTFIRRLAVAGIGAMQVMMYAVALYAGAMQDMEAEYRDFIRWVSAFVATPVVFYAARPFFTAAWRDLKTRHLGMDVPVSIAIGGAYIASLWATWHGHGEVYFDSVSMFTFFLLLGRYLELRARHQTAKAGRALRNLLPASCLKLKDNQTERVPVTDLQPGDRIRVLPGDSVPTDGLIISGHSSLNESALTGEYMPVARRTGERVIAGSLNTENALDIEVTRIGDDTRLSAIVRLLERAQSDKPAIARIADRVAGFFVAAVLLTSIVVYTLWNQIDPGHAFWVTLSVLVVTCPCALSLATPAALTASTGTLQKLGILISRGHVLEGLNQVSHVIFDKTGTLTKGRLILRQVILVKDVTREKDDLVNLASALESHSEHPIAQAFSGSSPYTASDVTNTTGKGLSGYIDNDLYRIGTPAFSVPDSNLSPPDMSGQWLLLSCNDQPMAWFELDDELRPEAATVVQSLKQRGITVELLSGDTPGVVSRVAGELGIDEWQAAAVPDDKLNHVRARQAQGAKVLMVGDGINDVPVLAQADLSLALNNATDLARTTADAVLLTGDLQRLLTAFDLARQTRRIIWQNLTWSLGYNITALPLAATGLIAPWMAAIGMSLSSLIVVGNAMRLTRLAPETAMMDTGKLSATSFQGA